MGWKEPMEKQHDKLTQDVHEAIVAGMSYGQYKAMQTPVPVAPKKLPEGYAEHTCACCGCTFVSYDRKARKYCGEKCRKRAAYEITKKRQAGGGK